MRFHRADCIVLSAFRLACTRRTPCSPRPPSSRHLYRSFVQHTLHHAGLAPSSVHAAERARTQARTPALRVLADGFCVPAAFPFQKTHQRLPRLRCGGMSAHNRTVRETHKIESSPSAFSAPGCPPVCPCSCPCVTTQQRECRCQLTRRHALATGLSRKPTLVWFWRAFGMGQSNAALPSPLAAAPQAKASVFARWPRTPKERASVSLPHLRSSFRRGVPSCCRSVFMT